MVLSTIMGGYNSFATITQFVLYGRKHFRQPAYERIRKTWIKEGTDLVANADKYDMTAKVCMVTGSNSGIGKEIAEYLAKRGACVYMVVRNKERGVAARNDIVASSGNENIHILQCDVSLQSQVRTMWNAFLDHRGTQAPSSIHGSGDTRSTVLDVLVCNAGALLNKKTVTEEAVEVTFASHLVFGTHLLGKLAMSSLERTPESRMIITTSGGMYGTKFPKWDVMLGHQPEDMYNGTRAYAQAKRGQVLLAERWGDMYTKTKIVTAHPGWTKTPGTAAAFGSKENYLNPMRTPWEGADGIAWLCCCDASLLDSGSMYLDRRPQTKHIAGPFFTEGSHTKNSKEEVDFMMAKLDSWNHGPGNNIEKMPSEEDLIDQLERMRKPLKEMDGEVNTHKFMGKWYVIGGIPTMFEKGAMNPTEVYDWNEQKKCVNVNFYLNAGKTDKVTVYEQRATVNDLEVGTRWALCPKVGPVFAPLNLPYLIVYNNNYEETIIATPSRNYLWIMSRNSSMTKDRFSQLVELSGTLGYDRTKIITYIHTHDITDGTATHDDDVAGP